MKTTLIGISGKAGVGKDTLADYIVRTYGFQRYGFADPIKELLNKRFGWTMEDWNDRAWKEGPTIQVLARPHPLGHCQNLVQQKLSMRELAQWLGTEAGRETHGEDCWVNVFQRRWIEAGAPKTVIPDVRFENEAAKIRQHGGIIIHLKRDVEAVAEHKSEAGIIQHPNDYILYNKGTIERLHSVFDMWFETLIAK